MKKPVQGNTGFFDTHRGWETAIGGIPSSLGEWGMSSPSEWIMGTAATRFHLLQK
jgi:hypothetical protein